MPIMVKYPSVFSEKSGRYKGLPIKDHVQDNVIPVVQPLRRIPLHFVDRTKQAIENVLVEDIIEGPIMTEDPGTFISNLVITTKRGSDDIRVTLDCQAVNNAI